MNNELLTSIENPTLVHFRHFSSLLTNLPSTTVESALQISSFMQNKANLPESQMNVSSLITMDYENKSNWTLGENKPNQSQFQNVERLLALEQIAAIMLGFIDHEL